MTQSTPSALSTAGERHLSSYAAAALAGATVLTTAQVTQASILTYTYSPKVLSTTSTFQLFTNGPTLSLQVGQNTYTGANASHGLTLERSSHSANYAANLPLGAAISAGHTFLTPTIKRIGINRYSSNGGYVRGQFRGSIGYMGFKFTDPNNSAQTDYGWVRIGENSGETQLTIYSAGYDNTGGKINAGQTVGSVPEPGSLGLLAGGAGCIAAWRLRKAKRKQKTDVDGADGLPA